MRYFFPLCIIASLFITGCKDIKDIDAVVVLSSDSSHGTETKAGPPPHAPAHGYRHKHAEHGTELVFDSGLGVYVVMNMEDLFFFDDLYIRFGEGSWQVAVRTDGPWRSAKENEVPVKLKTTKQKGNGHGRGKAKGHEKHDW